MAGRIQETGREGKEREKQRTESELCPFSLIHVYPAVVHECDAFGEFCPLRSAIDPKIVLPVQDSIGTVAYLFPPRSTGYSGWVITSICAIAGHDLQDWREISAWIVQGK